ncbi:MAG TPA: amidohydrolase family protein [Thermoleophilia bacterium]|nr:amidohydrolase family protein [Thermoleophilia bacterium]
MLMLHSAPIVLPVSAEAIADGAVLVDGDRIAAVGPRADLVAAHPDARERAWAGVLTPGLVNAHAHLQYTDFEELNSLGVAFPVWLGRMVAKRATFTSQMWQESTRRGLHLMLKSGTTAVADIVTEPEALAPTARSGIAGISYLEAVFEDARSWSAGGRARMLAALDGAPGGRTVGVSPHTPYTIATAVFADCVAIARERGLRTHTHVAESPAEVEYVWTGTGPFAQSMTEAGKAMELIRDGGSGLSPAGYLDKIGALGPDVHAAHCVHCDAEDRELLRTRGVYAALCVRSNRILQAGEPPIAAYLTEGSPFAIGTDSLASSPSLDLLEEAAALRALARDQGYQAADLDRRIIEAATLGGAAAMGLSDVGRLAEGARADLAVFALPEPPEASVDTASGTVDTDAVYTALLDAAAVKKHRCFATVLGGTITHRA